MTERIPDLVPVVYPPGRLLGPVPSLARRSEMLRDLLGQPALVPSPLDALPLDLNADPAATRAVIRAADEASA